MQSLSEILPSVKADIKFRFSRRHYPDEINEMIQIEYDEKLMPVSYTHLTLPTKA